MLYLNHALTGADIRDCVFFYSGIMSLIGAGETNWENYSLSDVTFWPGDIFYSESEMNNPMILIPNVLNNSGAEVVEGSEKYNVYPSGQDEF